MLLLTLAAATAGCEGGRLSAQPALTDASCRGVREATARCYRLRVPEDRRLPAGRTIDLRIVVVPAADASNRAADPVVFLAGGPGQAAPDFIGCQRPAGVHGRLPAA